MRLGTEGLTAMLLISLFPLGHRPRRNANHLSHLIGAIALLHEPDRLKPTPLKFLCCSFGSHASYIDPFK